MRKSADSFVADFSANLNRELRKITDKELHPKGVHCLKANARLFARRVAKVMVLNFVARSSNSSPLFGETPTTIRKRSV